MIGKLLVAGTLAAMPAVAQADVRHTILAWFQDGAGVELYTETTGSTQQTSVEGAGMITHDLVHRIVVDSQNRIVFAYVLEAQKAAEPGAITIRLKPVSSDRTGDLKFEGRFSIGGSDGRVPTVSAVREFPSLKRGQEVRIEILANQTTGRKVYDVLRPIEEPKPYPGGPMIRAVERPISGVGLVVNGDALAVKSTWTAGKPARLYLPGHGAYYLAWENRPQFRLAGYVVKKRLIFFMDKEYVEITCAGNVLSTAESGPVFVYHDPNYTPEPRDGTGHDAELTTAGNLEALNAKK